MTIDKGEFRTRFFKIFSVDVLVKAGGFLLLPVYLQIMSPDEFGKYSYLFSIVGMYVFIFGMGQHVALSRFYHANEFSREELVSNIYIVLTLSFFLFLAILLAFQSLVVEMLFKSGLSDILYYIAVALAVLMTLDQIFMMYLYQSEQVDLIRNKKLFDFFCINILALISLYYIACCSVDARIGSMLVSYIIILALFYRVLLRKRYIKISKRSYKVCQRFVKNGIPVAIGSFANFFIAFGDRFVIEKLLDETALGIYSFAVIISGVLLMIFGSFQSIWLPYFFKEKNLDTSFRRVYKIIILYGCGSIVAGVGLYALVYLLANYFIDPIYLSSLKFLWLLLFAVSFQVFGMLIAGFYQIFEKNYVSVPINIGAGLLNIQLNYYFVENLQLLGAALSTVIVSVLLFVVHFSLVHFYKNRGSYGEYRSAVK